MCNSRLLLGLMSCLLVTAFLCTSFVAESAEQAMLTAAGKPVEGPLDVFLGEPFFDMQVVFDEGDHVREPYLAIAVDGTAKGNTEPWSQS